MQNKYPFSAVIDNMQGRHHISITAACKSEDQQKFVFINGTSNTISNLKKKYVSLFSNTDSNYATTNAIDSLQRRWVTVSHFCFSNQSQVILD